MNIALIGYGKMGHEIAKAAKVRGITVKAIIDPKSEEATHTEITAESLNGIDVCVDFTHPDAVVENIKKIAGFKKNIVVGTTGWYEHSEEVKAIVKKAGIGFIYASNFSIGVNIFFRMLEKAAQLINKVEEYDVYSYELHHSNKADSPSGTAKSIGEILTKNIRRKDTLVFDRLARKIKPNEIHVASVRAGAIPGTHVVGFDSAADTIELKHTARNREGFALGAVMAAQWIKGKKGFYTIDDMMRSIVTDNIH